MARCTAIADPTAEFHEQARFADAGIAEHGDGLALSRDRVAEPVLQGREFVFAPDEPRQFVQTPRFQPGARLAQAEQ